MSEVIPIPFEVTMNIVPGPSSRSRSSKESSDGPLGSDTGDVRYPMYLINGRPTTDPATFPAKPGERLRLRIINAGSDTPFRVALGGHRFTVTHADGFPVEPVEVDALLLGMGERYDVLVRVRGPSRW